MLSNSLGTDLHMWDAQVAAFAQRFRLVRYDRRGHGKSAVPAGPYTMERLGRDALAILDHLGIEKINSVRPRKKRAKCDGSENESSCRDVLNWLGGENELALGFGQHALADEVSGGDLAGRALDVIVEPIDSHAEFSA